MSFLESDCTRDVRKAINAAGEISDNKIILQLEGKHSVDKIRSSINELLYGKKTGIQRDPSTFLLKK